MIKKICEIIRSTRDLSPERIEFMYQELIKIAPESEIGDIFESPDFIKNIADLDIRVFGNNYNDSMAKKEIYYNLLYKSLVGMYTSHNLVPSIPMSLCESCKVLMQGVICKVTSRESYGDFNDLVYPFKADKELLLKNPEIMCHKRDLIVNLHELLDTELVRTIQLFILKEKLTGSTVDSSVLNLEEFINSVIESKLLSDTISSDKEQRKLKL